MYSSISEITSIWERVLKEIETRVDRNIFDSFFHESYIYGIQGGVMSVVVNSALAARLISSKYIDLLTETVLEVTETNFKIEILDADEVKKGQEALPINRQEDVFKDSFVNPGLKFDNFVVGTSNRDASQAALMIASSPAKIFNPLFIYSESGLGKTHLLHAIGNYIKENKPAAKILCITSDDFFSEYVKNLQAGKDTTALRDYCKNIDAFLIDDIQFLTDKKKTQELFYHVFNDLVKNQKQIVITSDRQPNELKEIEQRLVTRFSSGLTVQIKEPDRETCVAILKRKIAANNLNQLEFEDSVLYLLADKFSKNIRELEGALNKLVYYSILKQTNVVTIEMALEAVSTIIGGRFIKDEITEQKIINLVADYYNMTPSLLTGSSHTKQIVLARHVAMYLIRSTLDTPLKKIGQAFGGRDHTTVMAGVSNVDKMLKTDTGMKEAISELKSRIK
ncbi:MAG: chromosomal replication initiator protein DnaA [Erysipelotrichaceae bacterium]|jgi:chromosomal replication initiator protein|nr:chromosomal replication initiator protein DnaA [Erysipelotrichaceae bacterium]